MDRLDDIADESRLPYLPATPALQKQAPFKASLQLLKLPAAILFPERAALLVKIPGPAEILRHPVAELIKHPEILAGLPALKLASFLKIFPRSGIVLAALHPLGQIKARISAADAVIERTPFLKSGSGLRKIPGCSGAPEISFAKLKAVVPFSGGASFGIVIRLPAAFAENESASPVKRATPALDKLRGVLFISLSSD